MASAEASEPVEDLAVEVRSGDRAAVARALNLVEDRRSAARPRIAALLRALGEGREGVHRIGVTGPPGAGKSTLASVLALEIRKEGRTVGVLAVDPSSKRSGGALLGDRVRIETGQDDDGMFVRSLATAGELGGLARSAPASVLVLAAAFDRVIVETVGVGQSETDVEHVVDTVALVVQPGSGDALQFLKAGIMEIPDVLVVNKSDLGEVAVRARRELASALASARAAGVSGSADPQVVLVSAARREGIGELVGALERHRASQVEAGVFAERRVRGQVEWGMRELARRVGEEGIEKDGGPDAARRRIEASVRAGGGAI